MILIAIKECAHSELADSMADSGELTGIKLVYGQFLIIHYAH